MKNIKALLFVFVVLSGLTLVSAQEVARDSSAPCFNRLIRPTGWQIPQHSGKPARKGVYAETGLPTNLTFTSFAVPKMFFLPHYYVENGALNLVSLRFRADELKRLEVDGKPFAFVAAVRGADVGTAGSVWWVDRDGNGSFEEFSWNPKFSELPDWVKRMANSSAR